MKYLWPFLLLLAISTAQADQVPPADPADARVAAIGAELRCLVCQNQSIADSHADLAADLRREIREQIDAGKSDSEIRDYMVARYGDFILYRPPFKSTTLLLWVAPFGLLLAGIWGLRRIAVNRRRVVGDVGLSVDEQARLREIMAGAENEAR